MSFIDQRDARRTRIALERIVEQLDVISAALTKLATPPRIVLGEGGHEMQQKPDVMVDGRAPQFPQAEHNRSGVLGSYPEGVPTTVEEDSDEVEPMNASD